MERNLNSIAVGIDIGATKIVIAAIENGKKPTIVLDDGSRKTVACVAFKNLGRLLGFAAQTQAADCPENVVFGKDLKSTLGRDELHRSTEMVHQLVKVVKTDNYLQFCVTYKDANRLIFPEQVLALLLNHLRKNLENHFGKSSIGKCVISMCCASTSRQRIAMINTCVLAGFELNTLEIIDGSTAIAVNYWMDRYVSPIRNILLCDIGATALEVSLMSMNDHEIEVKASKGDLQLGGDMFVMRLVDHFISKFHQFDRSNKTAIVRVRNGCEKLKQALSTSKDAVVTVENFSNGQPFVLTCDRNEFNRMCDDLLQRMLKIFKSVVGQNIIDVLIIVGGGGRIPKIEELLSTITNCPVSRVLNQDESIAIGSALYASKVLGNYQRDSQLQRLKFNSANDIRFKVQQIDMRKIGFLKQQLDEIENDELLFQDKVHTINEIEYQCLQYRKIVQNENLDNEVKNSIISECNDMLDWLSDHDVALNDMLIRRKALERLFEERFASTMQKQQPRDYVKEAENFMNSGSLDDALRLYNQLVNDNPHDLMLLFQRAHCLYRQKRYEASISDCDKILSVDSVDNNFTQNVHNLRQTVEEKMIDSWVVSTKERYRLLNDRNDHYFEYLMNKNEMKNPKYLQQKIQLYLDHARFHFDIVKNCEKAINLCTKGLEFSDNILFLEIRANSYFNLMEYSKAIDDWLSMQTAQLSKSKAKKIAKDLDDAKRLWLMRVLEDCDVLLGRGEYSLVISKLNDVNRGNLYDSHQKFFHTRGVAYFETGHYMNAIEDFDRVLRCSNDHKVMFLRAKAYYSIEEFDLAIQDCRTILQWNPNFTNASQLKAQAEKNSKKSSTSRFSCFNCFGYS